MAEYTHEYSQYPDELIPLTNYQNVDDSIGGLVNQINALRNQGNYAAATELINQYASQLKKYNLDMATINAIVEEVRNTQIKAKEAGQFLSDDEEEPAEPWEGFVWIGGE